MVITHTVIKNEDAEKHLTAQEKVQLLRLVNKVRAGRASEGKQATNVYLIVNTDESYASDVVQILQRTTLIKRSLSMTEIPLFFPK
jgi:hypothetical protein